MACFISCMVSLVFIIGMIYFYNKTNNNAIVKHYKEQLPSDLKILYDKIAGERKMISIYGYILGFIISLIIIFYNLNLKGKKLSTIPIFCIVLSTSFVTNYFYYILSPKTDWMINHLNSPEQIKAWLQMYREMQYNYHMGLVLGIIGVGMFAMAFRC